MMTVPVLNVEYFMVDMMGRTWKECIQAGRLVMGMGWSAEPSALVLATGCPRTRFACCSRAAFWRMRAS